MAAQYRGIEEGKDEKEAGGAEHSEVQQEKCKEIKNHPRASSRCSGRCFPTSGALHCRLSSFRAGTEVGSPQPSGVQLWLFIPPKPTSRDSPAASWLIVFTGNSEFLGGKKKKKDPVPVMGDAWICSKPLPNLERGCSSHCLPRDNQDAFLTAHGTSHTSFKLETTIPSPLPFPRQSSASPGGEGWGDGWYPSLQHRRSSGIWVTPCPGEPRRSFPPW